jgi:1,4-dihydroxy-2-naphthoate octaprenyltransferase
MEETSASFKPGNNGLTVRKIPRFCIGFWRLADPKISLASFASIFLGAMMAAAQGPIHAGWLVLTVLGIFAIEVAKNASGEIFDFDSGTDPGVKEEDRSPFSGGKRVLVDHWLTRRQTGGIAAAAYAVGAAIGFVIGFLREPGILWIGLVGLACAYFYHAPPFKLSYRGLGEIAVGICYGPLIAVGTYLVQRGEVPLDVLLISVPLGLLIAAFLWINEFPDYTADRAANKRTLVVRLGKRSAARVFAGMVIVACGWVLLLPLASVSRGIWFGGIAFLPAFAAVYRLLKEPSDTKRLIPAQASMLLAFLLYSLGAGPGVIWF